MRVEFFTEAVKDVAATAAAGRPIFRDVDRVRIEPGNGAVLVQTANDSHRARFTAEWAVFDARRNAAAPGGAGMPIEDWPVLGPALVEDLRERGILTLEELAALADDDVARLENGPLLQARARAFLDAGERELLMTRVLGQNDALQRRVAELETRNAALVNQLETLALHALPPDRPGQGVTYGDIREPLARPMQLPGRSALDAFADMPPRLRREPQLDLSPTAPGPASRQEGAFAPGPASRQEGAFAPGPASRQEGAFAPEGAAQSETGRGQPEGKPIADLPMVD